ANVFVKVDNIYDDQHAVNVYDTDDCSGSIVGHIRNTNGCLNLYAFSSSARTRDTVDASASEYFETDYLYNFPSSNAAQLKVPVAHGLFRTVDRANRTEDYIYANEAFDVFLLTNLEHVNSIQRQWTVQSTDADQPEKEHASARQLEWAYCSFEAALSHLPTLIPTRINTNLCAAHLCSILTVALLANLQILWIHTVITKPSTRPIYQRLPSLANWTRTAPLAIIEAANQYLVGVYSMDLAILLLAKPIAPFLNVEDLLDPDATRALQQGYALATFGLLPCFVMCMATLPIRVLLIRIVASMLPDEEHPIVPLDPALRAHRHRPPFGVLDAWRRVPRSTWMRVCRIQAQAYVLSAGIYFLGKSSYADFHRVATLPMTWFSGW
ncbi:uncharacterized protein BO97DRAFT_463493, partial [Aspergillus homomorphus CBS 101889]